MNYRYLRWRLLLIIADQLLEVTVNIHRPHRKVICAIEDGSRFENSWTACWKWRSSLKMVEQLMEVKVNTHRPNKRLISFIWFWVYFIFGHFGCEFKSRSWCVCSMQHYMIVRQRHIGDFHWALRFPPPTNHNDVSEIVLIVALHKITL